MNVRIIFWSAIVIVLLLGDIYFGVQYFTLRKDLTAARAAADVQVTNQKILDFTKFFINEVLNTTEEVDFDTRLKLETAVRDLHDNEILAQWQKFVSSPTQEEAQNNVKQLLEILVQKIKTNR